MKLKKSSLIQMTLVLCLFGHVAFTQSYNEIMLDNNLTFDQKQVAVNTLYQNKSTITHEDSTGLKNYRRWNQFWSTRLNLDGTIGYTAAPDVNFTNCSSQGNWKPEGPFEFPENSNGVGRIQTITVYEQNHQIVYVGSNTGGVFKSTNLGLSWESVFNDSEVRVPGLGVLDIIIHPSNPDIVMIATGLSSPLVSRYGAGIYKTTNGGDTWVNVSNWVSPSIKYTIVDDLAFAPNNPNIVYATYEDKILKSIDGGDSFSIFRANPNGQEFEKMRLINSGSDQLLYVTTKETDINSPQIWRCVLNTSTWTNITSPSMGGNRFYIDVTDADPNKLYVEYVGKLFISSDKGDNFTEISTNIYRQSTTKNDIAVSPVDPNVMFMGGFFANKSINGGTSFYGGTSYLDIYTHHADLREITYLTGTIGGTNDSVLVGHDGGIHLIVGDIMYNRSTSSLNVTQSWDCKVSEYGEKMAVLGSQDNATFLLDNNVWKKIGPSSDGGTNVFTSFDNNEYAIISSNSEIILEPLSNNGSSKTIEPSICGKYGYTNSVLCFGVATHTRPFLINTQNSKSFYWGLWDIFRYELSASNIPNTEVNIANGLSLEPHSITEMGMSESDTNIIYFATQYTQWNDSTFIDSSLFKTIDGGLSWTHISPPNISRHGSSITSMVINPTNHDEIWVTYGGFYDNATTLDVQDKVYFSGDGGSTWSNYSEGLQNFPINEIIYEKGTNNRLYIASDLGVFYRDATMDQWECFNEGLPPVITTGLSISYCEGKIYAATYGRGLWSADLLPPDYAVIEDVSLNQTATWSTDKVVEGSVRIPNGHKLTIDNATISMMGGAKIIVEPGAELIITNATITNECGAFWGGIDIRSNANATTQLGNFPNREVGKLVITNSIISNADDAISMFKEEPFQNGGGIVTAVNTHFLNNRRAVEMAYFENHSSSGKVVDNFSSFKNCVFEIDENFRFDIKQPFDAMVSAFGVRGVKFLGCDFINSSTKPLALIGLYMYNTKFTVASLGVDDPSSFTDLKSGASAIKAGLDYNFVVKDAAFTDCKFGVVANGIQDASITQNTFALTDFFLYTSPVAIFLENANDFIVEENTIANGVSGLANPNPNIVDPFQGDDLGIVSKNTGIGPNSIYKNTFNNVNVSNVANGLNYNPSDPTLGLTYKCNEMNASSQKDFSIYGGDYSGIAGAQGATGKPVDNMFSTSMSQVDGHIANWATNRVDYYHRADAGGYTFEPTLVSGSVIKRFQNIAFSIETHCISNQSFAEEHSGLISPVKVGQWKTSFNAGKVAYDQAKYIYVSVVDGGDTYGLLTSVQSTNTQTAWEMRADLISSSPLSLEVVKEVIGEAFLSNALLHDVLMVNPHAARDEEVMDLLITKTTPMPSYMINSLLGIYEVQTQKDELEAEMAYELEQMATAAKFLQVHWSSDSLNPDNDSVLVLAELQNTETADWKAVEYHVSRGNNTEANALIDAMPEKFDLSDWNLINYTAKKAYFDYFMNVMEDNVLEVYQPTESQIQEVQQMANDSDQYAGRMAQNQWLWAQGKTYWPVLEEESSYKKAAKDPQEQMTTELPQMVAIYPNPAHSYLTLRAVNIAEDIETVVQIVNASGAVMVLQKEFLSSQKEVNLKTQDLASGHYFVLIYQNKQIIQRLPFEVVH